MSTSEAQDAVERRHRDWGGGAHNVMGFQVAKFRIPLARRLQTFAVLFWISMYLFSGITFTAFLAYVLFYTRFWPLSVAYLSFVVWDRDTCNTGGRNGFLVRWVRGWRLWKHFADFFPVTIVKTAELPPEKSYLFGSHPHGVLCSGAFSAFSTTGSGFEQIFPGLQPRLLTLEGQFWIPGLHRELLYLTGTCAANRRAMESLLAKPSGQVTVLVVGGAPEALNSDQGKIKLVLDCRKGFIKLALRFGVDLVPTFTFGENRVYDQMANPEGSRLRRLQDKLQHIIGFAPVVFLGRGMFQYNMGILPHRSPLHVVIGSPIPVPKVTEPSREQVEELHAKYVAALTSLYEQYNPKYGDIDTKLVIT